jgi:hypothetical protein
MPFNRRANIRTIPAFDMDPDLMRHAPALALALALSLVSTAGHAIGFTDLEVVKGHCAPSSHIAEGRVGTDLTKNQSRFFCDAVAIMPINGNPRHVLLTFTESKSHTRPQIGYAGLMLDDQMLQVQRIYLQNGVATPADEGYCKIFRKGGRISGIACGAKSDQGGRRTVPIVSFER